LKARSALSSITINNHRYHERLGNATPADTHFGRDTAIIERRNRIKKTDHQKPPLEPSAPSGLTLI